MGQLSLQFVLKFSCKTEDGKNVADRIYLAACQRRARVVSITVFEDEDTRRPSPGGYGTYCEQALLVVFEN